MGSRFIITDSSDSLDQDKGESTIYYVKKLVKLIFGSYTIILIALNLLSLAVMNGDLFADFTGGLVTNINSFISQFGDLFSYVVTLLISAIIFIGPLHYYAEYERLNIFIVLLITYFLTAIALGRMFRHPMWCFFSGFAVMGSFVITITLLTSSIDYIVSGSVNAPITVSNLLYSMLQGIFGMNLETLFFYAVLENGAFLGAFATIWGIIFSPRKKEKLFDVGIDCNDGNICKI